MDEVAARIGATASHPVDDGPLTGRRSRRPRTASTPPASSRADSTRAWPPSRERRSPGRRLPGRAGSRRRRGSWSWPLRTGRDRRGDRRRRSTAGFRPEIGLAELPDAAATGAPGLGRSWRPGWPIPPRAGACPYRGLMAFRPEDGDLFFGREEVVASHARADSSTGGFMAVVGASGSGKSSLVRAGLVPAFRRARDGPVVVMTPGSDPAAELRAFARRRPARRSSSSTSSRRLFTLCPDEASRARFIDALMDLHETAPTRRRRAPRRLLRTMRQPSAPRRGAGRAPAPARADADRRAAPGDREPRPRGGAPLEAGLVDTMLAEVEGEPGALPLLSHALYESWARRDGRVLTPRATARPAACGGRSLTPPRRSSWAAVSRSRLLMRRMLLRLTELGETTEDTRRRVPLAELIPRARAARGDRGARAVGGLPAPGRGRRLGRDRPRGADP